MMAYGLLLGGAATPLPAATSCALFVSGSKPVFCAPSGNLMKGIVVPSLETMTVLLLGFVNA